VYFLSDRGTMGYLRVVPRRDSAEEAGEWAVAGAPSSKSTRRWPRPIPSCQIGLTASRFSNAKRCSVRNSTLILAILVASASCLVVMAVGFRGIKHPMLTLAMLAVALTWALGFTTAMIGHLSVLSLAVVVVLFALGLDFAIAYMSRYLQLRREGGSFARP